MNVSEALTILSQKATSKNLQKVRLTIDGTQQRNEVTLDGKVVSYQSRVISFLCPKNHLTCHSGQAHANEDSAQCIDA